MNDGKSYPAYQSIEKKRKQLLTDSTVIEVEDFGAGSSVIKTTSFANFCEYILPYRMSIEPVQDWRTTYGKKFNTFKAKIRDKKIDSILID